MDLLHLFAIVGAILSNLPSNSSVLSDTYITEEKFNSTNQNHNLKNISTIPQFLKKIMNIQSVAKTLYKNNNGFSSNTIKTSRNVEGKKRVSVKLEHR